MTLYLFQETHDEYVSRMAALLLELDELDLEVQEQVNKLAGEQNMIFQRKDPEIKKMIKEMRSDQSLADWEKQQLEANLCGLFERRKQQARAEKRRQRGKTITGRILNLLTKEK